jgi:hypothetical protein
VLSFVPHAELNVCNTQSASASAALDIEPHFWNDPGLKHNLIPRATRRQCSPYGQMTVRMACSDLNALSGASAVMDPVAEEWIPLVDTRE